MEMAFWKSNQHDSTVVAAMELAVDTFTHLILVFLLLLLLLLLLLRGR
jgi:hypothetical protein